MKDKKAKNDERILNPSDAKIDAAKLNLQPDDFTVIGTNIQRSMESVRPSINYWKDAWRRLKKNKIAIAVLIYLVLMILGSAIFPAISQFKYDQQHWDDIDRDFKFEVMKICREEGAAGPMPYEEAMQLQGFDKINAWIRGDIKIHIFGIDESGADFWTRVWYGGRVSLFIGLIAALSFFLIGMPYGSISGLLGGRVDNIMMRTVEVINGIPYLIIVILLMVVMGSGIMTIVVALAAVGWTGLARLVRGQVVQIKEQEYVIAATTMGASRSRIVRRHILPNTLSVVIVNLTMAIPGAIFTESFLSYIGIGVPQPQCSWGSLCEQGKAAIFNNPQLLFIPAAFISLTMLSFNLFGDALRNVLDPRMRR
jgi:oligopeptide transport system permease protein